jgi:carbon-monoxide dehydrogenase medium subunit
VKPAPFAYAAPATLEEAVDLLAEHGEEAKILAGGQSLVPMMAFRLAAPSLLVDLGRIEGLARIESAADGLALGAMARHADVLGIDGLTERCPLVAQAVGFVGHPAIRNRGTVGGSLAHADPAAEWPAILLALDGVVTATSRAGSRSIAARELFRSYFTTSLEPDEVITEIRLPIPDGRIGSAFMELARRHGDFALVGVAAMVPLLDDGSVGDARLALMGVRDTAIRSGAAEAILRGSRPTADVVAEAAAAVEHDIEPLSDVQASASYRRRMAVVLARRAMAEAVRRAEGAAT